MKHFTTRQSIFAHNLHSYFRVLYSVVMTCCKCPNGELRVAELEIGLEFRPGFF